MAKDIEVHRQNAVGVSVKRAETGDNGDIYVLLQGTDLETEAVEGSHVRVRIDQEAALLLIMLLAANIGGRATTA